VKLFGLEIKRAGAAMVPSTTSGGWWPLIREPFSGAWQRNRERHADSVVAHHAVYACVTLIAADIGKLRAKLVQLQPSGIWQETTSAAFSPVLVKPNSYQNHIQFKEAWITSKLLKGNTYVLKQRDQRGVVVALHVLDPMRVQVLVSPDGFVFYQVSDDWLAKVEESTVVPASEIIHDRMNCLFHPLVGVSPLFAATTAAKIGLNIQDSSEGFFGNNANPGGVLTAPATISKATADRLQEQWSAEYSGRNSGKIAVLGDGLKFEPMRMTSVDAQTIEHLKWTAETVCSTFHVPPFKVGIGQMPTYQNGEILNQIYYSDCLQALIEQWEACMDDGLGLSSPKERGLLGVELDVEALLRMDLKTQIEALSTGVKSGILAPNEARAKVDQPPVEGGETPYLQQQNYSLAALARRDEQPAPSDPIPPSQRSLEIVNWNPAALKAASAANIREAEELSWR